MISDEKLTALRERYPAGTLIRLNAMVEEPDPVRPGSIGAVDFVDDAGNIHMKWECGRGLALIDGLDDFDILPTCPKCGKQYREHPALSRYTNGPICSDCGVREALESVGIDEAEQDAIIKAIHDDRAQNAL